MTSPTFSAEDLAIYLPPVVPDEEELQTELSTSRTLFSTNFPERAATMESGDWEEFDTLCRTRAVEALRATQLARARAFIGAFLCADAEDVAVFEEHTSAKSEDPKCWSSVALDAVQRALIAREIQHVVAPGAGALFGQLIDSDWQSLRRERRILDALPVGSLRPSAEFVERLRSGDALAWDPLIRAVDLRLVLESAPGCFVEALKARDPDLDAWVVIAADAAVDVFSAHFRRQVERSFATWLGASEDGSCRRPSDRDAVVERVRTLLDRYWGGPLPEPLEAARLRDCKELGTVKKILEAEHPGWREPDFPTTVEGLIEGVCAARSTGDLLARLGL